MAASAFVLERLPHRPPFLWLDRVLEINEEEIRAEKYLPEDLDVFKGHYPGHPLMPGVLLCEAVFQAGALLLAEQAAAARSPGSGLPVLTRIQSARFKREVAPGEVMEIRAAIRERLGPAWYMKGSIRVGGKVALQVEFSCALKVD